MEPSWNHIFFLLSSTTSSSLCLSSIVYLKSFWSSSLSFLCLITTFLPHRGGHLVILISLVSQLISRLWVANYSISSTTFVLPRLPTSIFILFLCLLKNTLHSILCITFPSLLFVLSILVIFTSLSNFSSSKPCSSMKFLSTNIPVALLSSNVFTITLLWFSNFSIPIFIQTSQRGFSVLLKTLPSSSNCCTSAF